MANQNKIARFVGMQRPLERPSGQRPAAKQCGLYLLALRSHVAHNEHLVPGRKLIIPIEPASATEHAPEPVKITRRSR